MPCFYLTFTIYCIAASLINKGVKKCDAVSLVAQTLLFYQNQVPVDHQCMAWGWTVSVEVQVRGSEATDLVLHSSNILTSPLFCALPRPA